MFLSRAGKEVLIKSIAQAILSYFMSTFQLPKSLCDELQSWEKLCYRKKDGGLSCEHLHSFNLALLGKDGWNLLSNPYSLVSRLFKAKYYPHGSFLKAKLGHNPSFFWRSVWVARSIIASGSRWRIGNGESVNDWTDPLIKDSPNFKLTTPIIAGFEDL